MKQYINIVGLLLVCLFAWTSCVDEDLVKKGASVKEGIPTTVTLSFTTPDAVKVTTKSAIDATEEYCVYNLYVFVFKKVNDSWVKELSTMEEFTTVSEGNKSGTVSLNITSGEKRIYAIANGHENPYMPIEGIEAVATLEGLKDLTAKFKTDEETVERGSTKLLMSGMFASSDQADGTDGTGTVIISPEDNGKTIAGNILLQHLDSKITFAVTTDEGISFTPKEWKVVNVPIASRVIKQDTDADSVSFFETGLKNFENLEQSQEDVIKGGGFTFYMVENRQQALDNITAAAEKAEIDPYQLREKQKKESGGSNVVKNGAYLYAPATATYVVFTGSFHQDKDENKDRVERSAEVTYTIHLGYKGSDAADFKNERGHDYTYNVKITGVDNIELEVETAGNENTENQPGAEGDVIASKTYLYVDAHYETKLITFKKENVSEDASFRVKTPFDLNGIDGDAKDIDWVWFVQNEKIKTGTDGTKGYYTYSDSIKQNRPQSRTWHDAIPASNDGWKYNTDYVPYPNPDSKKRMNIRALIALLKEKKDEAPSETSIYDSEGNATFTVFIDEYHYKEKFWREFVNTPNREMHILCDTKYSQDQESSLTTSNFLISQRSIKTFYDLDKSATAWGVETIREGDRLPFSKKEGESLTNGRYNMFFYMELDGVKKSWKDYILSSSNELTSKYKKVAYACLQRNRDLNGDGKIDNDEVKWYLPAINQLIGMWIGRDGFSSLDVALFKGDPTAIQTNEGRKQYHFMSSNYVMFWAEEGASIGNYDIDAHKELDYRCVRNLGGYDDADISKEKEPLDYVQYDKNTRIFNLERLNSKAIRADFSEGEIAVDNELNQANRPYKKFKVAASQTNTTVTQADVYKKATPCKDYSESNGAKGTWRMPNQRELSLIQAYAFSEDVSLSRTRSSLEVIKEESFGSVFYQQAGSIITLDEGQDEKKFNVRCVKDIKE